MKKYTFDRWLKGEIPNAKKYFSESDWEKLVAKRKEIYFDNINQAYEILVEKFQKALEDSFDEEVLIRSSFESLKKLLESSQILYVDDNNQFGSDDSNSSIQFINFIGEYDREELLECYRNVIVGRHADDAIMFADDIYKGLISNHLHMHIYAAALHKLYKHIETEYIEILNPEVQYIGEKIKWLGKPSQFGNLFIQLAEQGWIEKSRNTNRGLAEICFKYFDVNTDSFSSFYNEFTKSSSLSEGGQSFFQIKKNLSKKQ